MKRPAQLLVLVVGIALLGAMMATMPDYNRVFQPFRITASEGEIAGGRLFSARFLDWETAGKITFENYGRNVERDTQGIFLIAHFEISEVQRSIGVAAVWEGRSGRHYMETGRAEGAPGALDDRQFQPGLVSRPHAVFELPPDEIAGGRLLLSQKWLNVMDSELAQETLLEKPIRHHDRLELVQ